MPEPSDEEISALLKELNGKQLFDDEKTEEIRLALVENKEFGCIRILASLDALADANELSRADADKYIERLGFPEHYVENRRSSARARQARTKKMN